MGRSKVLVVDDKDSMREMLKTILSVHYVVHLAGNAEEALNAMNRIPCDVVLTDVRMPSTEGIDLLKAIKKQFPTTQVILMTAYGEIPQAVEAMKAGAFYYVSKPFEPGLLVNLIEKSLEHAQLARKCEALQNEMESRLGFSEIVGKTSEMKTVFDLIRKGAAVDANVLISGETGTGKELVARAIHRESPRSKGPFVVVHCAGVPRELMESELFGHIKGSFTGASQDKLGQAVQADGGTLLLDDVNYLPMELQAKVNRLVQEKEIKPVGSNDWQKVDVRILATTNVSLRSLIQEGKFREDLYFRLSVLTIQLPPLRERREDIPELVNHFIKAHAQAFGRQVSGIHPEAMKILMGYNWPGNVRELENVVGRAIILSSDPILGKENFKLESPASAGPSTTVDLSIPYSQAIDQATEAAAKEYLVGLLKMFGGNVTKAAQHAGIERQSLHRLMKRYGVKIDREVDLGDDSADKE